ncbi:MAG: FAD-binding protein [Chloroflexi bacterium]|nr:FAD-binding protein [Chloroflexota bacterium]
MSAHLQEFAAELRKLSTAEVYTDLATRLLYSTDASIYQIMPLAVVVPRHVEDVLATMTLCARERLPVLPRGGGSSLAGQAVGEAVVIDFSKYFQQILAVDSEQKRVQVQVGLPLDNLNRHLQAYGLMVGPDPASGSRAVVGGIIGNNSTGAHSIVYGKMSDHVLRCRTILADGSETWLQPVSWSQINAHNGGGDFATTIHQQITALIQTHRQLIDKRFPSYWRRSDGYNLDILRRQLDQSALNLTPLLVGSEGTLGIVLEAEINLVPIPPHKALAILHFQTADAAFRAVPGLLELQPAAIELIDDVLMQLTRTTEVWRKRLTFIEGEPQAVLIVEFAGDEATYVTDRLQALKQHLHRSAYHQPLVTITDTEGQANVWHVRKAGLNLLLSMRGDAKPVPGIEDVAVPPQNLAAYMAELKALMDGRGVVAAMYAHVSAGCVHVRPILNLKTQSGVRHLMELTRASAELAQKYGGVKSSEHADGLARSFLNPDFFGPELYAVLQQVKGIFDPDGLMNPGKIVDPLPPDQNLRFGPDYHAQEPASVFFDWSHDGSFAQAVEMCNGAGVCRKLGTGTMCPSFQALRDEKHSTRGRANLLRAALTGALPGDFTNPDLLAALDLCLGCKACKSECPSSVDMTKLKAEALAQSTLQHGPPLSKRVFGHIARLSAWAAPFAPVVNFSFHFRPTRAVLNKILHVHPQRHFPAFHRSPFSRQWRRRHPGATSAPAPDIVLFPDTFTEYNEPEVGWAAVRVLEAAGLQVGLAPSLDCGRPMLSQGLVADAKLSAARVVAALAPYAQAGIPVVGLEPSSVLTIRDDYPDLLPGPQTQTVAANIFLFDEYVAHLMAEKPEALRFQPATRPYLVHGHCHQKALSGEASLFRVLSAIPGAQVHSSEAGCCGMAGAFGYDASHYELSVAIANDRLLPAIAAAPDAIIVANGTSCRHQIADLGGRTAVHVAVALADALDVNA